MKQFGVTSAVDGERAASGDRRLPPSERWLPFSISGSSTLNGVQSVAITVALRREHSLPKSELFDVEGESWSEWQDLNLRPPRPERGSGPAEFASAFASELLSTG